MPLTFALSCRHCLEPDCVFACISGALSKNFETGRVIYDKLKCVGCYSCVMACPYGCITMETENQKIVKCDLCAELDFPYCVSHCPNEALVYVSGD